MRAPEPDPSTGLTTKVVRLVSRHRVVVASLTVLGMLAGALYGALAPTTYTAESLLLVGTFEAPAAAIPGYVLASQTVAGNYARLAGNGDVLNAFAENLGVSPADARGRVTVTAIPESAVIRVTATSDDADAARAATDAMSDALVSGVNKLNQPGDQSALVDLYKNARADYDTAAAQVATATTARTAASAATAAQAQANLDAANQALAAAQLRMDGIASQYKTGSESVSTSSQIRSLGAATVSEQSKGLDTLFSALIGLLVGGALGLAVAWFRDRSSGRVIPAVDGDVRGTDPEGDE